MMKERLRFIVLYYIFWLLIFIFSRFLFLLYHFQHSIILSKAEWLGVFYHGFRLDLSMGAYLLLIPSLLIAATAYAKPIILKRILDVYTAIIILIIALITVTDLELYSYWGFRLDTTPLLYTDHPKEMAASVSIWIIIRQLIIAAMFFLLFFWIYKRFVSASLVRLGRTAWKSIPIFLLIFGMLIIPIRGGTGVATLSPGSVYFSKSTYANQVAVNEVFNLAYAFTNLESVKNPYIFTEKQKAKNIVDSLYIDHGTFPHIINSRNPNILIILLESFTAKLIEPLGGERGVTPNFTRLAREGLLFRNIYSTGSRSDKGMVAVLSGFPGLPTLTIIKYPQKTIKLPFISHLFKNRGYHLSFYHGGDIDFVNMRSYFTNGGFEKMISKKEFDPATYNSKWGVQDNYLFQRLLNDLNKENKPFFSFFFTLSSHEPFEVPVKTPFTGSDLDSKFFGSVWYTDSCLGDFIDRAKKTTWWNNTLVILIADHGSNRPGDDDMNKPRRYHIPMLWLGGALNCRDSSISKYASQTDLARTLLMQLEMDTSDFRFSKNILSNQSKSFAFYFFNDGFGYADDQLKYAFDNINRSVCVKEGDPSPRRIFTDRCYLQYLYDTFMNY